VLLLLYVPFLAATVMRVVFTRAVRRLDESHPDDLPLTAGQWLAAELERLGLHRRVRTMVTDKDAKLSLDGYHPFQGVIQLSADTHFKRDPLHWAIAAHELGHARFHTSWPVLGRVIIAALYIKRTLVAVAVALVLANVAYALPHVTNLALLLFATAIALHVFVLLDEIVASTYAMRMLRASSTFSGSHIRSARRLLALAFSTYVIGFLSRALLVTQWPLVERLTRDAIVPPLATLTTLGTVLAIACSVVLVISALTPLLARLVKVPDVVLAIAIVLRNVAVIGLVLLVWNLRADVHHAYWVMLALIPVQAFFVALLMMPMMIVDVLVLDRFTRRLVVDTTHRTSEFIRDHAAGKPQRMVGNVLITDLIAKAQTSPPLEHRVLQILRYSWLPLLIAFWLA
jgi:Zn-dependent membrane protease YugP